MGRPILPKEHGAWAVLFGSFLAGVGVAGRLTVPGLLLLAGVIACAFANGPLAVLVHPAAGPGQVDRRRRALAWFLVYASLASAALVPLVVVFRLTYLLPFGMGAAFFFLVRAFLVRERGDRTLAGELVGMAGGTMVAPAAHAVSAQAVQPAGAIVWLLVFLFFASGVFYVRMRVHGMLAIRQGISAGSRRARLPCVLYHVLLVLVVPVLAMVQVIPWLVLLAFAPAIWRAASGLRQAEPRIDLRRLGWSEVAVATAFVLLLISAFRITPIAG